MHGTCITVMWHVISCIHQIFTVPESGTQNNILLTAKTWLQSQNSPHGMGGGQVSLRTLRL